MRRLFRILTLPWRYHFWGSLAMVITTAVVISAQVRDRRSFADGDLHRDVMDRWGAPIAQPMPSVRYVSSGTVFNRLEPLSLDRQRVHVTAAMSYRKRGLVYFSGFDFGFRGEFAATNTTGRDIDLVFVFPINLEKNKVMLKDLLFLVNGEKAAASLPPGATELVWTGRLAPGRSLTFLVAFSGRGLDSFVYTLDPALPVRDFELTADITGGDNFDYPDGVAPATHLTAGDGTASLTWQYASLESGIPVGVILPSEQSFDGIIATIVRRAWAPFLLFFAGTVGMALYFGRKLSLVETYLIADGYSVFLLLLAYLAAFVHFYVAFALSLAVITALLYGYVRLLISHAAGLWAGALALAFLAVPSAAVILEGYTGLIYTLGILALVAAAMALTTRPLVRALMDRALNPDAEEGSHVS